MALAEDFLNNIFAFIIAGIKSKFILFVFSDL